MADLKISQLNSIVTVVPATDVLPVVQGGTTLKITPKQILESGSPAVLASATITGALTVDTTTLVVNPSGYADRVGIGTATPAYLLDIADATIATRFVATNTNNSAFGAGVYLKTLNGASMVSNATLATSNDGTFNLLTGTSADSTKLSIGPTGVFTFQNVGGVAGTAMTLNSTGLGIGDAPATNSRLTIGTTNATGFQYALRTTGITTGRSQIYLSNTSGDFIGGIESSVAGTSISGTAAYSGYVGTSTTNPFHIVTNGAVRATINSSGVLMVGRTSALSAETFSSIGFALIGGATHQAIIGEASGNVFGGSFTNTPFRIRTNNTEVAQFDASGNFLSYLTSTAPTLSTNGAMVFNLTSNTNLRISVRGTDGTTRTANITLA